MLFFFAVYVSFICIIRDVKIEMKTAHFVENGLSSLVISLHVRIDSQPLNVTDASGLPFFFLLSNECHEYGWFNN